MQVHEHDIGREFGDRLHSLLGPLETRDHVDLRVMQPEQLAEALTEQAMVLDENDVDEVGRALVAHVELVFGICHRRGAVRERGHDAYRP